MEENNEFDICNRNKQKINAKVSPNNFHFAEREIWWCAVGKNIGSEENGKNFNFERPILVFRIFGPDTLWAIPLTTSSSIRDSRKEYIFTYGEVVQVADLVQLRLISTKRLLRYSGIIPYNDFQTIRILLKDLM